MYPLTTAVLNLYKNEQRQVLRITGTDSNNTAISITDADIVMGGFNVDRFILPTDTFQIGTACAAELTLKLNNSDGRFDNVIFQGTELFVEIGIADWSQANPTIEYMPVGYFTPEEQPRRKSVISIKALDRMMRFDKVVEDINGLINNPAYAFVQRIGNRCNVPVTNHSEWEIDGYINLVIETLPALQESITYRDLIAWIAGVFGGFAYIDWNGSLFFRGICHNPIPSSDYAIRSSNRFDSDVSEDNILITGVMCKTLDGDIILKGTDDYVLDLSTNFLISQGGGRFGIYTPQNIAQTIYNYIVDYRLFNRFRPFSATVVNAPYLWPLDRVRFYYGDGTTYYSCIITNINFGINGTTEVAGKGQTKTLNNQASPNSVTPSQSYVLETMAVNSQIILASGTKSFGTLPVGAANTDTISFDSTLSTSNYIVVLQPVTGNITAGAQQKTTTGFTMYVRNVSNADATGNVAWAIIKLP